MDFFLGAVEKIICLNNQIFICTLTPLSVEWHTEYPANHTAQSVE